MTPPLKNDTVKEVYEYLRKHFKKDPTKMTSNELKDTMEKRIATTRKDTEKRTLKGVKNLMGNKKNEEKMMAQLQEFKWIKSKRGKKTFSYARRIKKKGEQIRWNKEEVSYFKSIDKTRANTRTKAHMMTQKFGRGFTEKSLYMKRFKLKR